MPSELSLAIKQIAEEKNISQELVIEAIETALAAAYNKDYGDKRTHNIKVTFDIETMDMDIVDEKTVVDDALVEAWQNEQKEREERIARGEIPESRQNHHGDSAANEIEKEEPKYNPKTMIGLTAALAIKPNAAIGDVLRIQMEKPEGFGRMAAQTAKQVIIQKLREAERTVILANFQGRVGEVVNGMIQRVEGRTVFIDLNQATGALPFSEQIHSERYRLGARMRVYIKDVRDGIRGPEIILSRAAPELVSALFMNEVPEITAGTVTIKSIAREAGSRTKLAVATDDDHIDPVGSCVGQRGSRVQTVIQELGGEKIDIIEYDEDPKTFIAYALSPAKCVDVEIDEELKRAKVLVAKDQLSLAIGKNGQNVRLASQLTGWNIDIVEAGGGAETPAETAESTEQTALGAPTDEIAAVGSVETKEEIAPETNKEQLDQKS